MDVDYDRESVLRNFAAFRARTEHALLTAGLEREAAIAARAACSDNDLHEAWLSVRSEMNKRSMEPNFGEVRKSMYVAVHMLECLEGALYVMPREVSAAKEDITKARSHAVELLCLADQKGFAELIRSGSRRDCWIAVALQRCRMRVQLATEFEPSHVCESNLRAALALETLSEALASSSDEAK